MSKMNGDTEIFLTLVQRFWGYPTAVYVGVKRKASKKGSKAQAATTIFSPVWH
jgi:hypothetical protein